MRPDHRNAEALSVSETMSPISVQIWDAKYRLKTPDGTPIDKTIEDTWLRVAKSLASVEDDKEYWTTEFYNALEDFKFLPAGRIVAGAGTVRNVTLFNCFVMGKIPDSLDGIFTHLKEAALTMQQGGGIGYDFSTLRPKGSLVKGVDADASGPLSFMDVWNTMCKTIMSAGTRRGAMMAVLRCDHPDIEEFIVAKRDPLRLRHFNLSVLATDPFMEAVKHDLPWDLVFNGKVHKTISARNLFDQITKNTYDCAEPGVIFIDQINRKNNLYYCETIYATNPCGEQPLPPYGACLLGSINLARMVKNPFTDDAYLNITELTELVTTAVRMMDNVVDVSGFPLEEQRKEAHAKRRIGLGLTGLADALTMMQVKYNSKEGIALATKWAKTINNTAYYASSQLAREKGSFPLYVSEQYLAATGMETLDEYVVESIRNHGIRNSHLTSVAPTGTISLTADNISSGIEPIFALSYTRKVLQKDGSKSTEQVEDYALKLYNQLRPNVDENLPDYFVTTEDLKPSDHVAMQAAVQAYVDTAISKTINCPADISFTDFQDVYLSAYEQGCKGCTTYRPNDITGSVLEVTPAPKPSEPTSLPKDAQNFDILTEVNLIPRPKKTTGATYKLQWPENEHAMYVTINDIEQNGKLHPYEVFINSKNLEHYSWVTALTRMISAVFRRGGDVKFVAEELKQVFDPRGGQWHEGKYTPSLVAALGEVIRRHMIEIGFIVPESENNQAEMVLSTVKPVKASFCTKCNTPGLVKKDGCEQCLNCGWSKCG